MTPVLGRRNYPSAVGERFLARRRALGRENVRRRSRVTIFLGDEERTVALPFAPPYESSNFLRDAVSAASNLAAKSCSRDSRDGCAGTDERALTASIEEIKGKE